MLVKFSKREWIIFAAGAQAFHTFSHIMLMFTNTLPLYVFNIEWTTQLNYAGIIINGIVTIALLKWAQTCKR